MTGARRGDDSKRVQYLAGVLMMPRVKEHADRLADTARDQHWGFEEYLAAVLEKETIARTSSGTEQRIRQAGFPARKTLTDFDFDRQPDARAVIHQHQAGAYLAEAWNLVFLGPPGTGKTHLAIGLGIEAARQGKRVSFATATTWITRLHDAHHAGRLPAELARIRRIPLIIIDELGYIPFDADAANLFFQLVSTRYEQGSMIITSNQPFTGWGDMFTDPIIAAAMIDRIVHHANVIPMKGASYRLKHHGDTLPSVAIANTDPTK